MNGEQGTDIGQLEERLAELEQIAEKMEGVSDSEAVDVLDRAVVLLEEVNAGIEAGLLSAENQVRELGGLLESVDFGPFDEALEDLERPPGGSGGG